MSRRSLFDVERSLYWPSEFADLVNLLKGTGPSSSRNAAFYKFNTGVMVLAAMVGLSHKRTADLGVSRQEISTSTFESHKLGDASLGAFIFLVALLSEGDLEILRPGREDRVIRNFERYAAGGFHVLQEALTTSADSTGLTVILAEVEKHLTW